MAKSKTKSASSAAAIREKAIKASRKRRDPMEAPQTPQELWEWVRDNLETELKRRGPLDEEDGPFEYLNWAYFEGGDRLRTSFEDARSLNASRSADAVVLACRGGGKTYLGAVATALDMLFKRGIEVKILAGSVEQGARMHAHLREIFLIPAFGKEVKGRMTDRRIALRNKSSVEVLAQSETSIRGVRAQKIRCDEVEMFGVPVWDAVQLVTKSKQCGRYAVSGTIEVLSTRHKINGVMQKLIDECSAGKRRLFRWDVSSVMGRCVGRECGEANGQMPNCQSAKSADALSLPVLTDTAGSAGAAAGRCVLWEECRGRAKREEWVAGHLSVEEVMDQKRRAGERLWGVEMRNEKPRREFRVLPEFDPAVHVVEGEPWEPNEQTGTWAHEQMEKESLDADGMARKREWVCGVDFGFRSPTVVLWGVADERGVLWIVDERVESELILEEHVRAITGSRWGKPDWVGVDPAGRQVSLQTGKSAIQLLAAAELSVRWRPEWIHSSMAYLHDRLKPAVGLPRLYVHARCEKLIAALEDYHYDGERPYSVEPVKDGPDHVVDALRYMVVNLDKPSKAKAGVYGGF